MDGHRQIPTNDFLPFADVQHLFKEGDDVVITEKIRSNAIYICRDEMGVISVTSKRFGKLGLLLPEYTPETFLAKVARWALGRDRHKNYFWQAAYNSGLIGRLRYWPRLGEKIEVFGSLVPSIAPGFPYSNDSTSPSVLIERVTFAGKDQGYHTFFSGWTPLLAYEKFDPEKHLPLALGDEQVTGLKLHRRDGILIRHQNLRRLMDGRPLIAAVFPRDVEAWCEKKTAEAAL
jgi:hypothetical protein